MTAVAKVLSYVSGTTPDIETLKVLALFSGIGLVASLLIATAGLDLGLGVF
jgi:hypothetical protein